MAENSEEWMDDDTRVDVWGLFVLEDGISNSTINEILMKNADDVGGDSLLWLADSYDNLPPITEEQTEATNAPIDPDWRSPFIGNTIEHVAAFVGNAPKPLSRVFFAVLEKDSYVDKQEIRMCKIVGGHVQSFTYPASEVATYLSGHDRDTWEENWKQYRDQ